MRSALPTVLLLLTQLLLLPTAWAQVLATHPFSTEIDRARALEAGASPTDIPHHVHYDLKLYNRKGKLTTGTWDIWRDPQHYIRAEIVAGDFHYTHIEDLARKLNWRHFNTVMPLKVYDLRQNYREPDYLVKEFSASGVRHDVGFLEVAGSPFDCTSRIADVQICFDPLVHMLAFAQMYNETVTWGDWQPLGSHSVPKRFRIYDAGRVMVEAAGIAEEVKKFPDGLFVIPANEPDMGEPEDAGAAPHQVTGMKPIEMVSLYGNVLIQVSVDAEGKVHKTTVIDADDEDLVHDAEEFAHHLTFAPQIKDGVAVPFEQYIYLRHAPAMQ